jgi:hypothetical protein
MKKFFTIVLLSIAFATNAQEKIKLPLIVSENFQKQFKEVDQVGWSMFYRGKYNKDLRYEAEFLRGNSKYLVSYTQDGFVKAIQKSIPLNSLNNSIQEYIQDNYPTFNVNEATVIVKDNDTSYYNVSISSVSNFFILVFNDKGTFLNLTFLGERI